MLTKLKIIPSNHCLITRFTEYFLNQEVHHKSQKNFDASNYWILLPTQRLATSLRLSFSAEHPNFIPPKITTLPQLLKNLVETFLLSLNSLAENLMLPPELRIPGDLYATKWMEYCLEKYPRHHKFSPDYCHELMQLHKEIHSQGLNSEIFFKNLRNKSPYFFSNESSAQTYDLILQDLLQVFKQFETHLESHQYITQQHHEQKQANLIVNHIKESKYFLDFAFKDFEKIFILGISSFNENLKSLLYQINQHPKIFHWNYANTEHSFIQNQHRDMLTHLQENFSTPQIQEESFSTHRSTSLEVDYILACDSPWEEAANALQIASMLHTNLNIPAHSIGILVTEEQAYASTLHHLKDLSSDPWLQKSNIALSRPVTSFIFGSWLSALKDFLKNTDNIFALLDLVNHPFSQKITNSLSSASLLEFACEHNILSTQEICSKEPNFSILLEKIYTTIFTNFLKLNIQSKEEGLFSIHLENTKFSFTQTRQIFGNLFQQWVHYFPSEATASIKSALNILCENFLSEIELALDHKLIKIEHLKDMLLVLDDFCQLHLQSTGEPALSFQILKFDEARHLPLKVAILIGCREGQLPKAKPKDILVSDFQKRLGGLPGWQGLESMEYLHFAWLQQRVPHKIYLYSKNQETAEAMPSCFLSPGIYNHTIQPVNLKTLQQIFTANSLSLDPKQTTINSVHHDFFKQNVFKSEDFLRQNSRMSSSSLSKLLKCPMQYLSSKLQLDSLKLPSIEERPNERGSKFHKFFECFFKDPASLQLLEKARIDGLAFHKDVIREKSEKLLGEIFSENFLVGLDGSHFIQHSWILFIEWLLEQWPDEDSDSRSFVGGEQEYSFANVAIKFGKENSLTFNFQGQIDSIRSNNKLHIICDYKTSKIPESKYLQHGIEAQLLIYYFALKNSFPLDKNLPVLAGYWSILKGEWKTYASEDDAVKLSNGLASAKTQNFTSRYLHVNANLEARLEEMNALNINPFFADSSFCDFCEFDAWCRKKDPRFKDSMAAQMFLKRRIKQTGKL